MKEVLWGRNFEKDVLQTCLKNVGASFLVSGHTTASADKARRYGFEVIAEPAFGHVHHLQLLISSHLNSFGYLHADLTQPLPDCVDDIRGPGGKPCLRMLQPKGLTKK